VRSISREIGLRRQEADARDPYDPALLPVRGQLGTTSPSDPSTPGPSCRGGKLTLENRNLVSTSITRTGVAYLNLMTATDTPCTKRPSLQAYCTTVLPPRTGKPGRPLHALPGPQQLRVSDRYTIRGASLVGSAYVRRCASSAVGSAAILLALARARVITFVNTSS